MTGTAYFHLPGLFEFYDFYKELLRVYSEHREYFYDFAAVGSIYGAPEGCIWGGGRLGAGENNARDVLELLKKYRISGRLTFSNSLLNEEHLRDRKCNRLCRMFVDCQEVRNGIIIHSDLLLDYIKENYPGLYFVSSTTKVITDFDKFRDELKREEFSYVVPDYRINKQIDRLNGLSEAEKKKVEFLCNECCWIGCTNRKECYENVSRTVLDENYPDYKCVSPGADKGYIFSNAMENPAFISVKDITDVYIPNGFSNFKIEGRTLGSAVVLEMILYYMVKPEYQLRVREEIYLDSMLNIF